MLRESPVSDWPTLLTVCKSGCYTSRGSSPVSPDSSSVQFAREPNDVVFIGRCMD